MKERTLEIVKAGRRILIRPMRAEDTEAVAALEAAVFSQPWSHRDFLEMVEKENTLYIVAVDEERIVGCCGVWNICGDGNISNVLVEEKLRCQGIGRLLLQTLFAWGEELGITAYTLEVRLSNASAIHLYESLGFERAGIRPRFYKKPEEDALIMWKRQAADGQITIPNVL